MTTKVNVGDAVLVKGVVDSICVNTVENKPIYSVRIKNTKTNELISIENQDKKTNKSGNSIDIKNKKGRNDGKKINFKKNLFKVNNLDTIDVVTPKININQNGEEDEELEDKFIMKNKIIFNMDEEKKDDKSSTMGK